MCWSISPSLSYFYLNTQFQTGLISNKLMFVWMGAASLSLVILLYVPFVRVPMGLYPLGIVDVLLVITLSMVCTVWMEIVKYISAGLAASRQKYDFDMTTPL